jgi:glutamate-1-semialdehyde 2,1-aminomutase
VRLIELFNEAKRYIPGGVNSPVRAFKAVDGTPLFIKKGKGSRIVDEDDKEYIDYCMSWGPLILGHAHSRVIDAVKKALEDGTSFGAPTRKETELSRLIVDAMPSIDKVRLVNSGTEAVMSALRLARGFTGKDKVIKFEGCYHGHVDSLLVKAGSGLVTLGDSAGVGNDVIKNTLIAEYNNIDSVKELIKSYKDKIAAVIIEPIAGNMGVVLPGNGFLEELMEITKDNNILLIFDEVITGFRVGYGGAQGLYKVKPDLTVLGKVIGGGLPVGAYGGRKEIMEQLAPVGNVYQAGTLAGNPIATTAGIETLKILEDKSIYKELKEKTNNLTNSIEKITNENKKMKNDLKINKIASMFTLFFNKDEKINNYKAAKQSNVGMFAKFHKEMLRNGIYLPPSQFESCFLSAAHSEQDIEVTVEKVDNVLNNVENHPS